MRFFDAWRVSVWFPLPKSLLARRAPHFFLNFLFRFRYVEAAAISETRIHSLAIVKNTVVPDDAFHDRFLHDFLALRAMYRFCLCYVCMVCIIFVISFAIRRFLTPVLFVRPTRVAVSNVGLLVRRQEAGHGKARGEEASQGARGRVGVGVGETRVVTVTRVETCVCVGGVLFLRLLQYRSCDVCTYF